MDQADAAPVEPRPRGRSGAPTIYDVATRAGVNPSTVSRALNQPGRVSAATEARIRAAAAALDFHVNPMARGLPTGRTNTIALVVADITNPVVFGIVRGAERAAAQAGFTLVIAESQESGDVEAATVDRVAPAVDGIVLATTRLADTDIARLAARTPVVVINRALAGVLSVEPVVGPGVHALVEHLADLGHRSLAFVSGPETSSTSTRRWDALVAEATARGLSIIEIGPNRPTLDGGRSAYPGVAASGATAIVAFNDLLAIGVIQALKADGRAVPGDVSVAGFDDIFGAEFMVPALTTVYADLVEAGARAVTALLGAIGVPAGPQDDANRDDLVTSLIIRDSTGRAPAAPSS